MSATILKSPTSSVARTIVGVLILLLGLTSTARAQSQTPAPLVAAPTSQASPWTSETSLHLIADRGQLFATFLNRQSPRSGPAVSSVVLRRGVSDASFDVYSVMAGSVTNVTLYRGQLAALLSTGEWRSLYAGGYTIGPAPPAGFRITRIAGNGASLFAVAYRARGYTAGTQGDNETLRLLRLDPVGWTDLGVLPDEVGLSDPIDLLATVSETPGSPMRVFLATAKGSGDVSVYEATVSASPTSMPSPAAALPVVSTSQPAGADSSPSDAANTSASELLFRLTSRFDPGFSSVAQLRLLDLSLLDVRSSRRSSAGMEPATRPSPLPAQLPVALWVDPGQTSAGVVVMPGDYAPRIELGEKPGEVVLFADRVRLFFSVDQPSGTVLAALLDASSPLYERAFDPVTGLAIGDAVKVKLPGGTVVAQVVQFLFYVLVAGSTLLFYFSSRKRVQPGTADPTKTLEGRDDLALAPVSRRLAAGVIDFLPVIAVATYVSYFSGARELGIRELFLLLVSYATVLTHTLLSELITNRSLGKALMGLRLAALDGSRPQPGKVVLRCLLKVLEIPTAYSSILFSPLRQSLSDSVTDILLVRGKSGPDGEQGSTPADPPPPPPPSQQRGS